MCQERGGRAGEMEIERAREREKASLLFVIQSHPDSKPFEVLSREIGFDHVDLMNCEQRGEEEVEFYF